MEKIIVEEFDADKKVGLGKLARDKNQLVKINLVSHPDLYLERNLTFLGEVENGRVVSVDSGDAVIRAKSLFGVVTGHKAKGQAGKVELKCIQAGESYSFDLRDPDANIDKFLIGDEVEFTFATESGKLLNIKVIN